MNNLTRATGPEVDGAHAGPPAPAPLQRRIADCCRNGRVAVLVAASAASLAAGLVAGSLKLPVWHLKMEAPQYQGDEALRVRVYPGHMDGSLREISVLNQYIGVHIPSHLPQFRWLPIALMAGAALGLLALALPGAGRSRGLFAAAALLSGAMIGSAAMAQTQMHRIGHHRDEHTILKGVADFTPPLLGRVKVANFVISAGLSAGAYLIGLGIALQCGAGLASRRQEQRSHRMSAGAGTRLVAASPEPASRSDSPGRPPKACCRERGHPRLSLMSGATLSENK